MFIIFYYIIVNRYAVLKTPVYEKKITKIGDILVYKIPTPYIKFIHTGKVADKPQ